jgi:exo-poly-alpha-galacturonosidase
LRQITVFSALGYNNDGEPAPEVPRFENFTFRNINMSAASTKEPVIDINGFKEKGHRLRNVVFSKIVLPNNSRVVVNDAEHIKFEEVKSASGEKPQYVLANSEDISY